MTAPKPTGRVAGNDLILTRTFEAPIDDVWTSITSPESCARWYGRWEGESGPGKTIRLQMLHEQGEPWTTMTIEACEAPRHLVVTSKEHFDIRLELTLAESAGTTTLTFVHRLHDRALAGDFGAGWEYYLDMLAASREGAALPKFEDYYPSQKPHFTNQL